MMTKRSMFDEIRREGELRTKRRQEIIQEVSGWRHRLTTAEKRIFELDERKKTFEAELKLASSAPDEIKFTSIPSSNCLLYTSPSPRD